MFYFTADEHYGHRNIIKKDYCNRPFSTVEEMDEELIRRFNLKVKDNPSNVTIHAGDFTFVKDYDTVLERYISKLNGSHIFLRGSHDYWIGELVKQIGYASVYGNPMFQVRWEQRIGKAFVVVDHYRMTEWARSHYNTWQLHGHNHGSRIPVGKQWDIGVDNNDYEPVSFNDVKRIMKDLPDNRNLLRDNARQTTS